ncbi:hypothetical protein CG740_03990 [Streptomyces sp. CB01201]|uniref:hypothetical protein n=1 Tax=Streptomyces sp. CB01201 TaxID=2020324 RepID=UPI000C272683|nr:hypothetical protein [Streptomyces sp. CB01201]PJN05032.1 hypothetical protein CG740_03990 [Streptomyces sp. CB01201]
MPAPQRERHPRPVGPVPALGQAEATLVEHYPRLVRLAYLILPPRLGRHRRVLAAHGVVQNALPARPAPIKQGRVPAPRDDRDTPALDWIVRRVVSAALSYEGGAARWRRAVRPALPAVWGLRLTPRIGGADELALEQQLATVPAGVRAAFVLQHLEGYAPHTAVELLAAAGVPDPEAVLRAAEALGPQDGTRAGLLLGSVEFDPCTVQARPTDLLRRRHWRRWGAAGALLVAVVLTVGQSGKDPVSPDLTGRSGAGVAMVDPASLGRAPGAAWQSSSRIDFTVWPARGSLVEDRALLGRALRAWARPGADVRVSAAPRTGTGPTSAPPQLLYAGQVDDIDVVLFHDAERIVRYAETAGHPAELTFSRADNADVTTAAALVLVRTEHRTRFLFAPWVAESTTRDLLAPDSPARPLHVGDDGVSDAVARPDLAGPCTNWPVLQLRSSERIAEKHAFLLTDLGDPSPVHLTYTPPPGSGAPARQPREATSSAALVSWSHAACTLRSAAGGGVRAVNNWVFAEQQLPENAGQAEWLCSRADTWNGPGRAVVRFQPPTTAAREPGTLIADARDTSYCSRFNQHLLADARWSAPSGTPYLLAAGSRAVTRITVTGQVRADGTGTTLAVKAPPGRSADISGVLSTGRTLGAVH